MEGEEQNPYRSDEISDPPRPESPPDEIDLSSETPFREFVPMIFGAGGCLISPLALVPVVALIRKVYPVWVVFVAIPIVLIGVPILAMFVGGWIKSAMAPDDDESTLTTDRSTLPESPE